MTVVRSVFTVLMFVISSVSSGGRGAAQLQGFDDAASLPFADEDTARATVEQEDPALKERCQESDRQPLHHLIVVTRFRWPCGG